MRSSPFFKNLYDQMKTRLLNRALTNGECYKPSPEEIKKSKGKLKKERFYIKGRKNQSVEAWAHSNAFVRVQRTLLHLIYTEWMRYEGLEPRVPYALEYLGHMTLISLDDVLKVDNP